MNPVIKDKITEIRKLFEELDGLAAQEATPTQYPVFKQVGYLPAEWVTRFNELQAIPRKDRTEEQAAAIDEMFEQMADSVVRFKQTEAYNETQLAEAIAKRNAFATMKPMPPDESTAKLSQIYSLLHELELNAELTGKEFIFEPAYGMGGYYGPDQDGGTEWCWNPSSQSC